MTKYKKNTKYETFILILLIFFFIGYFGVFALLSNYIPPICIYLILLFVWIIATSKKIYSGISNFKKEYFNDALSAVIVILIVSSLLFVVSNFKIIKSDDQQVVTTLIFSSLIYAPVVEELVNRYALGLFLEKIIKKDYLINIITSLLFSFFHIYKMQLELTGVFVYGIIYFLLGFTCGYYYRKTDNILVSMLVHFIWNLLIISGVIIEMIF